MEDLGTLTLTLGLGSSRKILASNTNPARFTMGEVKQGLILVDSEEEAVKIKNALELTGFIEAEDEYDYFIPLKWTVIFRYVEIPARIAK